MTADNSGSIVKIIGEPVGAVAHQRRVLGGDRPSQALEYAKPTRSELVGFPYWRHAMAEERRVRHSLRRRITLSTLLIFLASIWALSYYASRMLREDMERMLADQQSSTVSYVAGDLNDSLEERVLALEKVARLIDAAMLAHPAALQQMLANRLILQG